MRRALESVYQIISSLSHSSGQGYFDTFVSEIANAVGADFVLVSGQGSGRAVFTVHAAYPPPSTSTPTAFPSPAPGRNCHATGEAWFCDRTRQLFPTRPCWNAARSGPMPASR